MDISNWGWEIGGALTLALASVLAGVLAAVKLVPWSSMMSWFTVRRTRRSDFAAQRILPIEHFSELLFEFHDRLTGVLSMWGPDAPYEERIRERAMELYYTRHRELSTSGIAAREAARRIDRELERRVSAMEAESANLVTRLDTAPLATPMKFFIERNDETLALQQAVVDRVRELVS